MSHAQFIKRLSSEMDGQVRGYLEDGDGCLLYLSRGDTIFVPQQYIDLDETRLFALLREAMTDGVKGARVIRSEGDRLFLEPTDPPVGRSVNSGAS